jgi:hypothetical protein
MNLARDAPVADLPLPSVPDSKGVNWNARWYVLKDFCLNKGLQVVPGAFDWPKYSMGEYADEQAQAKANHRGMWARTFMPPWEWRAERRAGRITQPSLAN